MAEVAERRANAFHTSCAQLHAAASGSSKGSDIAASVACAGAISGESAGKPHAVRILRMASGRRMALMMRRRASAARTAGEVDFKDAGVAMRAQLRLASKRQSLEVGDSFSGGGTGTIDLRCALPGAKTPW